MINFAGIETEVVRGRKRVTGVSTNKGLIKTEKVTLSYS